MHVWLDFVATLQEYTSFAYSWSTSEECKNLDTVVLDQLLETNTIAIAYHMEEYRNSGLVVILHCLNSFQHKNYVIYVLLRENQKINAVCFPSFHSSCNQVCKGFGWINWKLSYLLQLFSTRELDSSSFTVLATELFHIV